MSLISREAAIEAERQKIKASGSISRADAINAVLDLCKKCDSCHCGDCLVYAPDTYIYDVIDLLTNLPTAEVTLCHLGSPCEYQNADIAMPTIEPVKWISVSERLPIPNSVYEDVSVYYLVQNEYGDMMVATYIQYPGGARVWQQMYQYGAIMEDIVAWMPLPEPWSGT